MQIVYAYVMHMNVDGLCRTNCIHVHLSLHVLCIHAALNMHSICIHTYAFTRACICIRFGNLHSCAFPLFCIQMHTERTAFCTGHIHSCCIFVSCAFVCIHSGGEHSSAFFQCECVADVVTDLHSSAFICIHLH